MNRLRRVFAVVLPLLGVLGLLGSLGAVAGLWIVKRPLEARAVHVLDRIEIALGKAGQGLRAVRESATRARQDLDEFKRTSAPESKDTKQNALAMKTLAWKVNKELAPRVSDVHATLTGVTEASVVLGSLLQDVDRLPLVRVGKVDTEELQNLTRLLGEVGETSRQLSALIPQEKRTDDPGAAASLHTETPAVEEALSRVQTAASAYESRVADLSSRVAAIHTALPDTLQTGAVVLTAILVWVAVSQIIVVLYGLSLWRKRSAG
jgi:hypothetical protein